jgi:hypothetical protein
MITDFNIKKYIADLISGKLPLADLTRFVYFTRSVAESYLLHFRFNVLQVCYQQGISVSDLGIDCIGELFSRDEHDAFYIMNNFVESLREPLKDIPDNQLFFAYKSFVSRLADAQLARTYAQIDPVGARLHRNIKEAIKKSNGLILREDFRGYMIYTSNNTSNEYLDDSQLDDLERRLLEGSSVFHSAPKILEKLSLLLQDEYQKAVRLIDIVQILKKYLSSQSIQDSMGNGIGAFDDVIPLDMTILRQEILRDIQSKIFSTYVLTAKINKKEAQSLYAVLFDIVTGICNRDTPNDSYYAIAKKHLSLSKEEYNADWRVKIEYLARLAREKLILYFTDKL